MMTLSDCADLCLLDHDDLMAMSAYDHIPEVANATLSAYLSDSTGGDSAEICKTMIGDIRCALDDGFVHHATELMMALRHFLETNPQAAPGTTFH